ncbi:hypothetical protein [Ferdinandcohnia sp. Marseille-Q9671]
MSKPNKTFRLNKEIEHKAVLLSKGVKGFKVKTTDGRVLTVKISNELSPRGKAVKVQLENEREEILKRAQSMDQKFAELLQLVSSK